METCGQVMHGAVSGGHRHESPPQWPHRLVEHDGPLATGASAAGIPCAMAVIPRVSGRSLRPSSAIWRRALVASIACSRRVRLSNSLRVGGGPLLRAWTSATWASAEGIPVMQISAIAKHNGRFMTIIRGWEVRGNGIRNPVFSSLCYSVQSAQSARDAAQSRFRRHNRYNRPPLGCRREKGQLGRAAGGQLWRSPGRSARTCGRACDTTRLNINGYGSPADSMPWFPAGGSRAATRSRPLCGPRVPNRRHA